jgi:hypothetical protein
MSTRFDFGAAHGSPIAQEKFVVARRAAIGPRLPVPRERVQIDIAASKDNPYALSTDVDYVVED